MVKENEEKTKKMNRGEGGLHNNRKQRDEEEKGKREKDHKCTGRDSREF